MSRRRTLATVAASLLLATFLPVGAPVTSVSAAPAPPPNPALVGSWSKVIKMPTLPAHLALLPDGNVMMWVNGSYQYVWNPQTMKSVRKRIKGTNLMCAGFVGLSDGRLFVFGGQGPGGGSTGLKTSYIYDWRTGTWTKGPDMIGRRWYGSAAALPDGEVLMLGGGPIVPEVLQADGTLRRLTTATLPLTKRYPFVQSMSDGSVGFFGHQNALRSLDTAGTGQWTEFGPRDGIDRLNASYAMFDIDKVLVAGGAAPSSWPTNTAVVVEKVGDTLVSTPTNPMVYGRRQAHLTILADGTVLSSGGQASKAEHVSLKRAVMVPELWDPDTGTWTSLAKPKRTRQYHSAALLLADGRVLTSGGGYCPGCARPYYNEFTAEIFSPPYLFADDGTLAVRPVIDSAPADALPGGTYDVHVTSASGVTKMGLVRLGADTHAMDQGQRYVPLTIEDVGDAAYRITLPPSEGTLPPGYYMLFAVDGEGVPSVASMVLVGSLPD